ncbi:nitroreductase family protein [Edaphobacter paludis]|uniref:Nitroreductase family protein n=1 Tax=Edaphobacter paludis TaxID=3035702 RepID=A0AAU7DD06_9BACT
MSDLLEIVRARHSAREPFDPQLPISRQDLEKILEAARWAPTAHNMQNFEIVVVDDQQRLQAIGSIGSQVSETFLRENYLQMSFSEEELLNKKTGVLASMFPASWRKPDATPDAAIEILHSFLGDALQQSTLLLVVIYDATQRAPASEGDVLGMMSLGCVMENMWLMAQSLGIGCQILSTFSTAGVEGQVGAILNIPPPMKIAFACRFGFLASKPAKYLRVRRDIDDFVHHNRFGNRGFD